MLQSGEYINDEITIGMKLLSKRSSLKDLGAKTRTAIKRMRAAPHARIKTILIGSIDLVAWERNG
jgi:hypothetical protein